MFPAMTIRLYSGSAHSFFPPGLTRFHSHISFLSHYLYSYASTYYSNTTCGFIRRLPAVISYRNSFVKRHPYTAICLKICQGLRFTHNTAIKSKHLHGSSAPRTYSIICISSESCLGSIVGFARLPCFGTLRSAISAKVALGELLQLCPGSSGRAPQ